MKHITFRDTKNLHSLYTQVRENCNFHDKEYPTVQFHGTVKAHGTHMDVVKTNDEIFCQGRSEIFNAVKADSFGFYQFFKYHESKFEKIFKRIEEKCGFDTENFNIVINGEWCGKGIQKGVAISHCEKMFIAHDVKFVPKDVSTENLAFYRPELVECVYSENVDDRIFNTEMFQTFEYTLDFNHSYAEIYEELMQITLQVENQCPIGLMFGVVKFEIDMYEFHTDDYRFIVLPNPIINEIEKVKFKGTGYISAKFVNNFVEYTVYDSNRNVVFADHYSTIGEGIVWNAENSTMLFKVKGEKRGTVNKIKKEHKKESDPDAQAKADFADNLLPEWRLEQGMQNIPSND